MHLINHLLAAAALGVVAVASPVSAQPMTAQQILSQFNAVVSNDFASQHDVEGRLVANRMVDGATFYNNPHDAPSAFAAVNALSVTQGLTNGNVNNSGNVNVIGTNYGHFNFNGGGFVSGPDFSMADLTAPLNALSASIRAMISNAIVDSSDPNNFTFIEGNVSTAVFRITAAELQHAADIKFTGSASTIIIDVLGTSFADGANFNGGSLNTKIIWNFEDATSLSFQGWHGTVLAGNATVTNTSAMEGTLYAANFIGGGELHDYNFDGTLPQTAVPEPASIALLGISLAGLGLIRRRS